MIQIELNLPESAFSALRSTPDEFAQELLIAAVVKWYEVGILSQSKASEIAGISREAFLQALNRFSVSPFQTNLEELTAEVSLQHLKTEPPQRNFLLTVAALGESGQSNISESDEEILRNEIDPIYGWRSNPEGQP